jgi:sugar lactone lactonase YvrE
MRFNFLLGLGFSVVGATVLAGQAQPQAPARAPSNLQAPSDPRYKEVIARCKTPPPAPAQGARGGGAGGARAGGGGAAAATPAPPPTSADTASTEIPDVIAAGQRWTSIFQTTGNNADGPIATEDGGLLIAQNDNGLVLKLDAKGQPSTAYRDTNTGGALTMSPKGALFVASRGINTSVLQLAPQRRVFANRINGDPLECLGGVLNDVTADSLGGVYFTMGGLFYADAKGNVTAYGKDLRTNGVILSPDEKTLYVTNGQTVAAFDVRPDGALTNQREFGKLPAGGGDGLAVDSAGRLYVTVGGGAGGATGVYVFAPEGKLLGHIPSPRPLITVAFSGPDKKTLFGIANDRVRVDVYAIPMIAQGHRGRAK